MHLPSLIKQWHYSFLRTLCGHYVSKLPHTDIMRTFNTTYNVLLFMTDYNKKIAQHPMKASVKLLLTQ